MQDVFKENSEWIKIYMATETVDDPFEKNTIISELNPLPIKAIVTDLISSQIAWKLPGIITERAKEIYIEKKYKTLLEKSYKIKIKGDSDYYEGWKINGRLNYRTDGNYIRAYIYKKQV